MTTSELDFDWGESSAPPSAQEAKRKKAAKKKVPDVSIVSITECRCNRKHKTNETFIKCALKKYSYNIPDKAALPEINVKGSGQWATIHESLSEVYSSYSYDTETEYLHQYQILDVILFETLEEAAEWQQFQRKFCQSKTKCSFSCNSVGMRGYVSKIVT